MTRFHLPSSYSGTGDPVDGNPFHPEDPRHAVWNEATLLAEEEVARINSAELGASKRGDALQLTLIVISEQFNVWARRGVKVVWSDADLRYYRSWLVAYANAFIDSLGEVHKSPGVPRI